MSLFRVTHATHIHNNYDLLASNYHDKSLKWEITKFCRALNQKNKIIMTAVHLQGETGLQVNIII